MSPESTQIAAIVATCDRVQLLMERSIPSILQQTRLPDHLIVVDDSTPKIQKLNQPFVEDLDIPGCVVTYTLNQRTPGAAGAWNTAVYSMLQQARSPRDVYLAVLDDDDAWHPDYLEKCISLATEGDLDMVAAGIRRIESNAVPVGGSGPNTLCVNDFLVGNPGIQGSNIFLRLETMLRSGGFDEGLRSSTDRDLCIRIADLGAVRYQGLEETLVDHYADAGRQRLSSPGSASKIDGMSSFWRKYVGRMSLDQRRDFCERASRLFAWSPPQELAFPVSSQPVEKAPQMVGPAASPHALDQLTPARHAAPWVAANAPTHSPFALHVGVITTDPATVRPLLEGLALLQGDPLLARLTVLVLDNGCPEILLGRMLDEVRALGLEVDIIDQRRQQRDASAGVFGSVFVDRPAGQVGIAQARSMLQRYLGDRMVSDPGSVGWVLDDDMRVDNRARSYLPWLPLFRSEGIDVLLGAYEGSSPNPPLNGLRVQLVDLLHNLTWLKTLPPEAELPDRSRENQRLRNAFSDYYYDLSRKHTAHLETPQWLEPEVPGELVREALSRLREQAVELLMGAPLTRPLVASTPVDPLFEARDSVNRGGCTFVLNPQALTDTPNTIIQVQGREARRSDMLWAIVNRHYRGMQVMAVGFPIEHVGRVKGTPRLNLKKVCAEIAGSALYGGLTSFLADRKDHRLAFTETEITEVQRLVDAQLTRRLLELRGSFYRISGLRAALRHVAYPGELSELLILLERWFQPTIFEQIQASVRSQNEDELRTFLHFLRPIADEFAAAVTLKKTTSSSPQTQESPSPTARSPVKNCRYSNWCTLPTSMGHFRMYDMGDEGVRVVCMGDIHDQGDAPLLRIHSSCLASEVFGALDCDCADQLREAMKRIAMEGRGMVIHLQQEGRGQGLSHKIHAVRLMEMEELDTVEAFEKLGLEQDIRNYHPALNILHELSLNRVRLISNNPRKRRFLERSGIYVRSERTHPHVRPENEEYLHTKNEKLGHQLPLESEASQGDIRFYHSGQPWGELSNFSRHAICQGETIWPTVEHYYQAQKFAGTPYEEEIRRCVGPMAAKTLARALIEDGPCPNWDAVKEDVMLAGLRAKFRQHRDLRERLLSTGERMLIEHTDNDRYWADGGDGTGANRLGVLLMKVRSELLLDAQQ